MSSKSVTSIDYATLWRNECRRRRFPWKGTQQKRLGNKWGYTIAFSLGTPHQRIFNSSLTHDTPAEAKRDCAQQAFAWLQSYPQDFVGVASTSSSSAAVSSQGTTQALLPPPSPSHPAVGPDAPSSDSDDPSASTLSDDSAQAALVLAPAAIPDAPLQDPVAPPIPRHLQLDVNINDLTPEDCHHRFMVLASRMTDIILQDNTRATMFKRAHYYFRYLLGRAQNEINVDMEDV